MLNATDSLSHSDTESEDAQSDAEEENENPYPLEGKYVDEADRTRSLFPLSWRDARLTSLRKADGDVRNRA